MLDFGQIVIIGVVCGLFHATAQYSEHVGDERCEQEADRFGRRAPTDVFAINHHCYFAYARYLTYKRAKKFCEEADTHLMFLESYREFAHVRKEMDTRYTRVWLGAERAEVSGLWFWTIGDREVGMARDFNFNNVEDKDHAVAVFTTIEYKPADKDSYFRFVCELNIGDTRITPKPYTPKPPTPEPPTPYTPEPPTPEPYTPKPPTPEPYTPAPPIPTEPITTELPIDPSTGDYNGFFSTTDIPVWPYRSTFIPTDTTGVTQIPMRSSTHDYHNQHHASDESGTISSIIIVSIVTSTIVTAAIFLVVILLLYKRRTSGMGDNSASKKSGNPNSFCTQAEAVPRPRYPPPILKSGGGSGTYEELGDLREENVYMELPETPVEPPTYLELLEDDELQRDHDKISGKLEVDCSHPSGYVNVQPETLYLEPSAPPLSECYYNESQQNPETIAPPVPMEPPHKDDENNPEYQQAETQARDEDTDGFVNPGYYTDAESCDS